MHLFLVLVLILIAIKAFSEKFKTKSLRTFVIDGSEEQQNIRSKRAKKPRTPGAAAVVPEPDQRLDNDQSEISSPVIPTGFLSPSVKEYLELGKSIPGKFHI